MKMFCENCGKQIGDDRVLCEQCEASEENSYGAVVEQDVSTEGFALNTSGDISHKKPGKGLIIGAVVAVVAALAVLIALLWGPIAGLFGENIKFETPQEHFSYVEAKAIEDIADQLTASYSSALAKYEIGETAYETEMHILLGDDLLALLGTYLGAEEGTDFSWLSDIMLNVDVSADTEKGQALVTLGLDDTGVISADVILNITEYMLWAAIPELSSTYLELDMKSLMDGYEMDYDPDYYAGLVEAMPSEQVLNQLMTKYIDIVFSKITKVESKTETLTVGQISQECTALVATVEENTLIEIGIAVLEAAKEDEELINALTTIMEYADQGEADELAEELKQQIEASIEDMRGSLEEASAENYILWTDYVDKKHNIIGRRITSSASEEELYYLTCKDGDEFALDANILDSFEVTGNGTDVKNMVNAEYVLDVEGAQFVTIQVVDLNRKKLDSGDVSGTVRLIPTDEMIGEIVGIGLSMDIALELVMDISGNEGNMEVNLLMGEELFAGITAEVKQTDATAVKAPTNTIDPLDEEALMDWISGFEYDTIVDNLGKAGLPKDYLDAVEQLFVMIQENMAY